MWVPNYPLARKYDEAKAKQLLKDAGYPNGFKCTVMTIPSNIDRGISLAIQNYLAKVNIEATLDYPDMPRFQQIANSDTVNSLLIFGPISGQLNYNSTISFNWGWSSTMYLGWLRTPEFKEAYNATMSSLDPDIQLMRNVTDLLIKQASLVPICEAGKSWALQPYVRDDGFCERSVSTWWKYEQAWLDK